MSNESSRDRAVSILGGRRMLCSLVIMGLVLMAATPACAGGSGPVRIATEGAYPPYNDLNAAGEIIGFERVMGDELCRRAGLECLWEVRAWDSMIADLADGRFEVIIAGMTITEERDRLIDFTQAYVPPSPSVFAAQAGPDAAATGARLSDPARRTGVYVAAQRGTIHADYLAREGFLYSEYDLVPDAIEALLRGDAEVVFADSRFISDSMAERRDQMTLVGPAVFIGAGVGAGVREDDARLKERLDRAITSMKEDGFLNELIREWFGPDARTFQEGQ